MALAVAAAALVGCNGNGNPGTGTTGGTGGILEPGDVTTLAGNGVLGDVDGDGGREGSTEFNRPEALAVDSQGNVYVADTGNNRVRLVTPDGNTSTMEGTVEFRQPSALALDSAGTLYAAAATNHQIFRVDSSGIAEVLAGTGAYGTQNGEGGRNGVATFAAPSGIAVDSAGNVYVSDSNMIRKIDTTYNVSTIAGTGTQGFADGPSGQAQFSFPRGLAIDPTGDIYIADSANNRIRKLDINGNVTTVAGNGRAGSVLGSGGPDGKAEFTSPAGIALDSDGNLFVSDTGDNVIRRIDPSGNVTAWAGVGVSSFGDGPAAEAAFANPLGIALTPTGDLAVADEMNNCIRLIAR